MIGNDIIDLSRARIESNWKRKGFLEKQFTTKERQYIFEAKNSFKMVWRLWSMKEAAYKIFMQQHKERFFAPIKLECQVLSEKEGIVSFKNHIFFTKSTIQQKYICTIASLEKEITSDSKIVSSKRIHQSIRKKIQERTQFNFSEIKQQKSISGAPNYYHKGTLLTKSCSISHHGNYGVFSIVYF